MESSMLLWDNLAVIRDYVNSVQDLSVKSALENIISAVTPIVPAPFILKNGDPVYVSAAKKDRIPVYLQMCEDLDVIQEAYLFGSVLTTECRNKSDIDVLFVVNCDSSTWMNILGNVWENYAEIAGDDWLDVTKEEWDQILSGQIIPSQLQKEILQKGVKIYDASWQCYKLAT